MNNLQWPNTNLLYDDFQNKQTELKYVFVLFFIIDKKKETISSSNKGSLLCYTIVNCNKSSPHGDSS